MIPTHIIEKAIAGGWYSSPINVSTSPREGFFDVVDALDRPKTLSVYEITLDPDFWMALGKEMGFPHNEGMKDQWWQIMSHRFYDLILRKAPQEEINSYWESISPNT